MSLKVETVNATKRLYIILFLALSGCKKNPDKPLSPYAKGKTVYQSRCITCHNVDPKSDGSLGPDIYGSSFELLRDRVLYGTYPEGYEPKRESKLMVPFPNLKNDIENLHAYLNGIGRENKDAP